MLRLARFIRLATFFVVASLMMVQHVAAQAQGGDKETQEAWVVSYALVILSVGLGLFVICRPGRRSKKVKAEPG